MRQRKDKNLRRKRERKLKKNSTRVKRPKKLWRSNKRSWKTRKKPETQRNIKSWLNLPRSLLKTKSMTNWFRNSEKKPLKSTNTMKRKQKTFRQKLTRCNKSCLKLRKELKHTKKSLLKIKQSSKWRKQSEKVKKRESWQQKSWYWSRALRAKNRTRRKLRCLSKSWCPPLNRCKRSLVISTRCMKTWRHWRRSICLLAKITWTSSSQVISFKNKHKCKLSLILWIKWSLSCLQRIKF